MAKEAEVINDDPCIGCVSKGDIDRSDCYCETRACYDSAIEEAIEKSDQMTIVKGNIHPCRECSRVCNELNGCNCHLLQAWKDQETKKHLTDHPEEYYYYQCQENKCDLITDGPKPCKLAIPKDQGDPNPIFCIYNKECKGVVWAAISKKEYDMIPTMRVNYFDGSYYTVRKDKPGWEYIVESLNRKKGVKFLLETSREEQIRIIKNVDLVKITEVEMTEKDYMKIPASPDIAEIQVELSKD